MLDVFPVTFRYSSALHLCCFLESEICLVQKHCFMSFKLLSLAEMEQIICVQLKTGSLLNYRLCADTTLVHCLGWVSFYA